MASILGQRSSVLGRTSQVQYELDKNLAMLSQYGYEQPKPSGWQDFKRGATNVLGTTLDILRTGEYAVGGLISGKGIIGGIKEKISPSEALNIADDDTKLWSQEGVAALAVDILLDPTTYITFGAKGLMKLTTKSGQVMINKTGKNLIKQMVKRGASEGAAKRAMARVIQEGGEKAAQKYIGSAGLKFMGQEFIPRSVFTKAARMGQKIPIAGAAFKKTKLAVSKAFIPFKEIDMLPAKLGGAGNYTDNLYKPFTRETQQQIFRGIDDVKKVADDAIKKHGKDIGRNITDYVEYGKITENKAIDDIVDIINSGHRNMLSIEKTTGKKIGEIDNYIRHYLTKDGQKFIKKGQAIETLIPKPLRAKLSSAKGRDWTQTISEINKYMSDTHGVKEFFEPDAFKAFAMRKAEHIKFMNTYNFLENTKAQFGTRLDKAKSTIVDGVRLVESTNPQMKGWLLPEPIVKHVDEAFKFMTNEETMSSFIKGYDKMLGFWKKNVTGIWPAFHTRNMVGGMFNNWLAGVKFKRYAQWENILKGGDNVLTTELGTKYTGKQIKDIVERYGAIGQPGQMDVARTTQDMIDGLTRKGVKKGLHNISEAPRWAMEQVEDRLRGPLFLDRLIKGDTPADAAKAVFKYHFDYVPTTGLTNFERLYMKRLFPFYTWTRNNIPLQLEQMMKQPGKYAGIEKLRQSMMTDTDRKDLQDLPEWMRDSFIAKLPWADDMGRSLWAQLDLPMEDINKLPISKSGIKDIASMLTPFIKYPMERFFNRNMYFGGDIINPDLPREMQTTKAIEALKHLPQPIKDFLNFKEVEYRNYNVLDKKAFNIRYEMDARKLHFINTFLGRYFSTLKGVSDEDVPTAWKFSRYVGGIPIRAVDLNEERASRDYEEKLQSDEILNYLKKHNIIPYASENTGRWSPKSK